MGPGCFLDENRGPNALFGGKATIYGQTRAGDVGSFRAREIGHQTGDLVAMTVSRHSKEASQLIGKWSRRNSSGMNSDESILRAHFRLLRTLVYELLSPIASVQPNSFHNDSFCAQDR